MFILTQSIICNINLIGGTVNGVGYATKANKLMPERKSRDQTQQIRSLNNNYSLRGERNKLHWRISDHFVNVRYCVCVGLENF